MKTILVVEDDPEVSKGLCGALEEEGYAVEAVVSGAEAVAWMQHREADLVLLDLGLPDRDGMELMAELRQEAPGMPVIILTARDGVEDRVTGLDQGAVDYILKPFALPELLARIRLHLRRSGAGEALSLRLGELEVNLLSRSVTAEGTELILPPREFELLATLLRNAGQTVSREQIGIAVWGNPRRMSSLDNLIDVHISRLRERLKEEVPGVRLRTIRGVGYTLEKE